MFWKKKKMLGKYVKYSKETALSNPTMILNEYDRLIQEAQEEIDCLENNYTKEYIDLGVITEEAFSIDRYISWGRTTFDLKINLKRNKIKAKITKLKLFEEYEKYQQEQKRIEELKNKIGFIEKEKKYLKKHFVKKDIRRKK